MKWSKYVKPYMAWFILGPLCMIVEVIGEVVMPKFLAGIIDYGTGQTDISTASHIYKKYTNYSLPVHLSYLL